MTIPDTVTIDVVLKELFDAYREKQAVLQGSVFEQQNLIREIILEQIECDLVQIKMSHQDYEPDRVLHLTSILDENQTKDLIVTLLALDKAIGDEHVVSPGRFWAKYASEASSCLGMAIGRSEEDDRSKSNGLWLVCDWPKDLNGRPCEKQNEIQHYKFDRAELKDKAQALNTTPKAISQQSLTVQIVGDSGPNGIMAKDFREICSALLTYPICALSIPVFLKPQSGERPPVFYSVELVWLQPPLPKKCWMYACGVALFVSKILPQLVSLNATPLLLCWAFAYKNLNKAHPLMQMSTVPEDLPFVDVFKEDNNWQTSIKAPFEYETSGQQANPNENVVGVWNFSTSNDICVNTIVGILKATGVNIKTTEQILKKRISLPSNPGILFLYYLIQFLEQLEKYENCKVIMDDKMVNLRIDIGYNIRSFVGVFKTGYAQGAAVQSFRRLLSCPKFSDLDIKRLGSEWGGAKDEIQKWKEPNEIFNDDVFGNSKKSHLMPLVSERFESKSIILSWKGVVKIY